MTLYPSSFCRRSLMVAGAFFMFFGVATAQNVGINTDGSTPSPDAMLDVKSTNKGVLIPRFNIPNLALPGPVSSPTLGLLVYNTNSGTGQGFYYWNGLRWTGVGNERNWGLTGNSIGTNDFLGTTNDQSLRFRVNNSQRFEMNNSGQLLSSNNGAAGSPTYSWKANTNMGMYRADANVLGFSTSGLPRLLIAIDGRVLVNSAATFSFSTFFSQATGNKNAIDGNASGAGDAVYGQNSGTGTGVSGVSNNVNGFGMRADNINSGGTGLFVIGNNANPVTYVGGAGIETVGYEIGINATATTTTSSAFGGYFEGDGMFAYVGGWNFIPPWTWTAYKIVGSGSVSTIVKDVEEKPVTMFCPEAPEVLFQDYGISKLKNGNVRIALDPILVKNIRVDEDHPMKVFIQLEGDCNGVYVTNKSAEGFEVRELQNGTSNVPFAWSIVATRANETFTNKETGEERVSDYSVRFPPAPSMRERESKKVETSKIRELEELKGVESSESEENEK